ncbi:MAG TPA: hypothetical protein PLS63_00375 [Microthrixaceae bacterium]|jgi:hypothetical protein|nr:hypothetical protein [Microthrixaceae bacterium]
MGCGCLIVLASAISPRFGLFLIWLFTDRIPAAFDGNWLFPIIGFFLLPWTTLAWALAWDPHAGISGFGWLIVAFAFCADLSTHFGAGRAERDRRAVVA